MGIVASNARVLARADDRSARNPRIGWHNVVTFDNIAATHELEAYPATNLTNPTTYELWKSGSTSASKLTVLHDYTDDMDYVGVPRHNWGSGNVTVSVDVLDAGGDPEDENDWGEVVAPFIPADDTPLFILFEDVTNNGIRINLTPDSVAPQAAVLRAGRTIVLPYGMPFGHVPISKARTTEVVSSTSKGGNFLGIAELQAWLHGTIDLRHLDADWYWQNLDPVQAEGQLAHFLWAWSPLAYPDQVAYCRTINDPMPKVGELGRIDITFEIQGLIL